MYRVAFLLGADDLDTAKMDGMEESGSPISITVAAAKFILSGTPPVLSDYLSSPWF